MVQRGKYGAEKRQKELKKKKKQAEKLEKKRLKKLASLQGEAKPEDEQPEEADDVANSDGEASEGDG